MLERIGVGSLDDLYSDVPDKFIYAIGDTLYLFPFGIPDCIYSVSG